MIGIVKIKNFKSIKNLEIKLSDINVIIGANGLGKSNFLSFFKMMRYILEGRMQTYFNERAGFGNVKYKGAPKEEKIAGFLEVDKTNAYEIHIKSNGIVPMIIGEMDYYTGNRVNPNYTYDDINNKDNNNSWHRINYVSGENNILESKLRSSNGYRAEFVYSRLSTYRIFHFHDSSLSSPLRQISNIDDNRELKENGSNLASILYKIQKNENVNYQLIKKAIHSIFPFFNDFKLAPLENIPDHIKLEWQDNRFFDDYMNASHFSDGTLRFIALSTLLLQKNPPKTIIIDEPELGLHPAAISYLGEMIQYAKDKGSQIIIATQSTDLLNQFQPNDIITVDYKDNQTVFNRLNENELSEWLKEFSIGEIWQKNIIGGN